MDSVRTVDIIDKKRRGMELSFSELSHMVNGFTKGDIPDYQMSAFMMAICLKGMSLRETTWLTKLMIDTGKTLDLSQIPGIKVDKHSTGGVGDTTTLITVPVVAACGGRVAKMSGRGLSHTGGTLDKLESIPGVSTRRSETELIDTVNRIGCCVIGQSEELVPADKLMYALRDVTATVASIPLIASSIMSKKIAAGSNAILLDVKVGRGAFMETLDDARALARVMTMIGEELGVRTIAIITNMDQPLGLFIGNRLEVAEALSVLSGDITEGDPLYDISVLLAAYMLYMSNIVDTPKAAYPLIEEAIKSGRAREKLFSLIEALGGDTLALDMDKLKNAGIALDIHSDKAGYISAIDPKKIGIAAAMLGAGREKKSDVIDPAVGIILKKRVGDAIEQGESIATLYVNDTTRLADAISLTKTAFGFSDKPVATLPIVRDIITAAPILPGDAQGVLR